MEYSKTLMLPATEFPMRAGLPKREPEMLERWRQDRLYELVQEENRDKPLFILHDGPPFSNGDLHMGHALNKVLKDFVLRYKSMAGFRTPYVPGWDNHGMPIESAIIKKQKLDRNKMSIPEFRDACRDFAQGYVDRQSGQFQRLGILGDWEHPYLTMDRSFEAEEIKIFGEMAEKGYIYKGLKPVYWCAHDATALAEAEVEYVDDACDSVYVRFALHDDKGRLSPYGDVSQMSFVIWTTTTWTLPGNLAICLHPDFDYALCQTGDGILIMAESLRERVAAAAGLGEVRVLGTLKGKELEYMTARHPFLDRDSLIIVGDHVTSEAGTGCVHTAPGHGAEDWLVAQKYDLPVIVPVDDKGRMTAEAGPFAGLTTDEANRAIADELKRSGAMLASERIEHPYPHCWRCKHPVLFRATEQWFASVDAIKEAACAEADKVTWYPEWGHDRMIAMIQERSDWCISRQRNWGLPIPVFYCESCQKPIITRATIDKVSEVFRAEGSNAWYVRPAEELVPEGLRCPDCGHTRFVKEKSTLDGWFDSGSTHAAVLRTRPGLRWPADLYLEGGDQYRGWFQSSLLTAVATKDCASPFKSAITNGWVFASDGRKMSKSEGNGMDPMQVCQQYGADILRLWVSSTDYRTDMRIGPEIFKQQSEVYLKIRNTCRFLLGNLADFDADLPESELTELDRWALWQLDELVGKVRESYDAYEYHRVFHAVHNFCVVEMSNFYLDVLKDRLYCEKADGHERRSAQTAIYRILDALVRLVAPILAYTSEELWQFMPHHKGADTRSVLLNDMPSAQAALFAEAGKWEKLIALREEVNKVLENARASKTIGKSLEAEVTLTAKGEEYAFLRENAPLLPSILIVSSVRLEEGPRGVACAVAPGEKCERCWTVVTDRGANPAHPTLCPRCAGVVS